MGRSGVGGLQQDFCGFSIYFGDHGNGGDDDGEVTIMITISTATTLSRKKKYIYNIEQKILYKRKIT